MSGVTYRSPQMAVQVDSNPELLMVLIGVKKSVTKELTTDKVAIAKKNGLLV
jgi:hypothetical protein